jgi:hypothetical protein
MDITIIGAGKLATNLGVELKEKGFHIKEIFSRTERSANRLAELLNCSKTTSFEQINKDSDLYIIALKDDAFLDALPKICNERKDAIFLHTSGSLLMSSFAPYANRFGVLYPIQTFSIDKLLSFSDIPIFIDANNEDTLNTIKSIATSISKKVYHLNDTDRKFLHIAAIFACNFSNYCYSVAQEILENRSIPFEIILPLIDETAKKVHKMSAIEAQTGPAARKDTKVIESHIQLLESNKALQSLYKEMSSQIINKLEQHNDND